MSKRIVTYLLIMLRCVSSPAQTNDDASDLYRVQSVTRHLNCAYVIIATKGGESYYIISPIKEDKEGLCKDGCREIKAGGKYRFYLNYQLPISEYMERLWGIEAMPWSPYMGLQIGSCTFTSDPKYNSQIWIGSNIIGRYCNENTTGVSRMESLSMLHAEVLFSNHDVELSSSSVVPEANDSGLVAFLLGRQSGEFNLLVQRPDDSEGHIRLEELSVPDTTSLFVYPRPFALPLKLYASPHINDSKVVAWGVGTSDRLRGVDVYGIWLQVQFHCGKIPYTGWILHSDYSPHPVFPRDTIETEDEE